MRDTKRNGSSEGKSALEPTNRKVHDPFGDRQYGLDYEETVAAVCEYFCRGYSPSEIADLMKRHYGVEISREAPYKFLRYATSNKLLQFVARGEDGLSKKIGEQFPWLKKTEVVHTPVLSNVAHHAAAMLVGLIREYSLPPRHKKEVHIGFAGGHTMWKVAENLAELLKQVTEGLPKRLVFHTLVAGFDVKRPWLHPNSFSTYFMDPAVRSQVETDFVGLYAPAIVREGQMEGLLHVRGIKEAYAAVNKLDIIVTSATPRDDPDSMLPKYCADAKEQQTVTEMLAWDGCVGDMLWSPLSLQEPIDTDEYPCRNMTLIELKELPSFIQRDNNVLLVIGPCGGCERTKTKILDAILHLKDHLITHLVVESRAARGLLKQESAATQLA